MKIGKFSADMYENINRVRRKKIYCIYFAYRSTGMLIFNFFERIAFLWGNEYIGEGCVDLTETSLQRTPLYNKLWEFPVNLPPVRAIQK